MWLNFQEIIFICFLKKLFLKKFTFSSSHDNKCKNYPIVVKFGIDVAFIYLQIEFVAQKNRSITKKDDKEITKKITKKIFESCFLREYLIYRLKIITTYEN